MSLGAGPGWTETAQKAQPLPMLAQPLSDGELAKIKGKSVDRDYILLFIWTPKFTRTVARSYNLVESFPPVFTGVVFDVTAEVNIDIGGKLTTRFMTIRQK